MQTARPVRAPAAAAGSQAEQRSTPVPREIAPQASVGSAYLARTGPSKLPWMLVVMLTMAVLGLVAYIVMQ
jgi:hypothetical protein